MAGELEEGEGVGNVHLADGSLLNRVIVLFGYARYDDGLVSAHGGQIESAEEQNRADGSVVHVRGAGGAAEAVHPFQLR